MNPCTALRAYTLSCTHHAQKTQFVLPQHNAHMPARLLINSWLLGSGSPLPCNNAAARVAINPVPQQQHELLHAATAPQPSLWAINHLAHSRKPSKCGHSLI
jgi:hypothetical protein